MSRIIDSAALDLINTALGITGVGDTEETIIDTRNVQQVLPILELVRRSMVFGTHGGIWQGDMVNIHAAAGDEESLIDPYVPGALSTVGFPGSLGKQYDVWILQASMERTAGAGTLDGALLKSLPSGQSNQAWGVNSSAAAVTGIGQTVLGLWASVDASAAGENAVGLLGDGTTLLRTAFRLLRGSEITYSTTAAGASATFRCRIIMGIFPIGLGQDVLT